MVIDLDRVKNRRCLLMSEAALTSRVHYDNHTKLLHLSGNSSTFLGCARLRQDPDVAGQISGLRSSPGSRVLQYVAKLGVRRYEIGSHSGSRLYFIKKCHVVPPPLGTSSPSQTRAWVHLFLISSYLIIGPLHAAGRWREQSELIGWALIISTFTKSSVGL